MDAPGVTNSAYRVPGCLPLAVLAPGPAPSASGPLAWPNVPACRAAPFRQMASTQALHTRVAKLILRAVVVAALVSAGAVVMAEVRGRQRRSRQHVCCQLEAITR